MAVVGGTVIAGATQDAAAEDKIRTVAVDDDGHLIVVGAAAAPIANAADKVEDAAHVTGETGSFALAVRNDNAATAFTDTNGDYSPVGVDDNGAVLTHASPADTATLTNVADTATSTTLSAAAAGRRGWMVYNDSTEFLFVKYGATASATSFTVKVAPQGFFEMKDPMYVGVIDGIWAADAAGSARITEQI